MLRRCFSIGLEHLKKDKDEPSNFSCWVAATSSSLICCWGISPAPLWRWHPGIWLFWQSVPPSPASSVWALAAVAEGQRADKGFQVFNCWFNWRELKYDCWYLDQKNNNSWGGWFWAATKIIFIINGSVSFWNGPSQAQRPRWRFQIACFVFEQRLENSKGNNLEWHKTEKQFSVTSGNSQMSEWKGAKVWDSWLDSGGTNRKVKVCMCKPRWFHEKVLFVF